MNEFLWESRRSGRHRSMQFQDHCAHCQDVASVYIGIIQHNFSLHVLTTLILCLSMLCQQEVQRTCSSTVGISPVVLH